MTWPTVKLGEVLTERRERVGTADADGLPLLGVSNVGGLHRSGLERIPDMSRYFRVQKDWFAYNPMRINVGSVGWAARDDQTGVISPDYVVFSCTERVLAPLVFWFLKHRRGLAAINGETAGSVRERLYFESLGRIDFPLPPLAEQRRLVARIDALATKIEEAKQLHSEATDGSDRLLICMAHRRDWTEERKASAGWTHTNLGDVVTLRPDPVKVDTAAQYPNLGIYSFARGLFEKPPIDGLATSASTLFRVRAGQFIYSRLFAFEGAYGVVPDDLDGRFVSNEYPTFDCDESRVIPSFLDSYFKSPQVWQEVAVGSKGLGDRRQRIQPEQVLAHRLWLPPMPWQKTIADTRKRLAAEGANRSLVESQLDAMLPAILDRAFRGKL
ncbi:MAG: restriction endonuclease subunit S [Gemmataceae bacterium]